MSGDDRHHKFIEERVAAVRAAHAPRSGIQRHARREISKRAMWTVTMHLRTHGVSPLLWNPGNPNRLDLEQLVSLHETFHEVART